MNSSSIIKVEAAGTRSIAGKSWDEKGHSKIKEIYISYEDNMINSLQFQYVDENGSLNLSELHGKSTGQRFNIIELNYPTEYITGVSGWRHDSNPSRIISLSIITNKATYGPFA
ncbi:Mannose-binding lectin [Corchorus capsularis]|uniref:Mannose-binding lectin n=1 Tax=Corchorus capsularis TaxID=210143 RepID=A0A1R3G604_COCAP|nr:Mannose-binding lectin [Corchorus capsularis]